MCDILCPYDQLWSNFRYFIDLSGTRTQIMATEDEDLSASVIFLGIFRGNGRVFQLVLQQTTRLKIQTVELLNVWCWIYRLER